MTNLNILLGYVSTVQSRQNALAADFLSLLCKHASGSYNFHSDAQVYAIKRRELGEFAKKSMLLLSGVSEKDKTAPLLEKFQELLQTVEHLDRMEKEGKEQLEELKGWQLLSGNPHLTTHDVQARQEAYNRQALTVCDQTTGVQYVEKVRKPKRIKQHKVRQEENITEFQAGMNIGAFGFNVGFREVHRLFEQF